MPDEQQPNPQDSRVGDATGARAAREIVGDPGTDPRLGIFNRSGHSELQGRSETAFSSS